jgi:threonine efflux protein
MPSDPPAWFLAAAVGTALLVSGLWWCTVALFFAIPRLRQAYARARRGLNAIFGGLLVCLGLRLAFSR